MLTIEQLKLAREIGAEYAREVVSNDDGYDYYKDIGVVRYCCWLHAEKKWCSIIGPTPGLDSGVAKKIDFSRLDDYSADKEFDIKATGGEVQLTKEQWQAADKAYAEAMKDDIASAYSYTEYSAAAYCAMLDAGYELKGSFAPRADWHIGYLVGSNAIASFNPKLHRNPVSLDEFINGLMTTNDSGAEVQGCSNEHCKYHREVKPGVWIDVYDVIKAWGVTNPAQQHLIKKALQAGERGHKDYDEDMDDVIASAKRAKELQND